MPGHSQASQVNNSLIDQIVSRCEPLSSLGQSRQNQAAATPAAVFVPLVQRDAEWHLILTQRSNALKHHGGQISFPGGRADPEDRSLLETAIRETVEEIGIERRQITPLARLPGFLTMSGFDVTPVIGTVASDHRITMNPAEVDAVFEVPVRHALDARNIQPRQAFYQGRPRTYHLIQYEQYRIWGVTAEILLKLGTVLGDN